MVRRRCGVCTAGTDALAGAAATGVVPNVPLALAVLSTRPAFTSACVVRYVPEQVRAAAGARVAGWAGLQVSVPSLASVMLTPVSGTLPSLVATSV